jgi:hypothetical protein
MGTSISTEREFRRRQKVVATVDLPGVPAGTFGKIWYAAGVTWVRYNVAFENGEQLANVDGGCLQDRKSWLAERRVVEQEELAAEREAERTRRREEMLANLADGPAGH